MEAVGCLRTAIIGSRACLLVRAGAEFKPWCRETSFGTGVATRRVRGFGGFKARTFSWENSLPERAVKWQRLGLERSLAFWRACAANAFRFPALWLHSF